MKLKASLKGIDRFMKKVEKTVDNTRIQAAKGLNAEGKIDFKEMNRRVPVDTGELLDSGAIEEATPNNLSIVYHYDAEHATIVHEDLEALHAVGQAKYMESVINESTPHIRDRVAKRIDMGKAAKGQT